MSTQRRTRNSHRTPSPAFTYTQEKDISQDQRKFKSCVDAGLSLTWTSPPNATPTTPPASSTQDSLPSLSTTPSSIGNSLIKTPGAEETLLEVLPRYFYFPKELSPTREIHLTDARYRKGSCKALEPVIEAIVESPFKPSTVKQSTSSNKYARNSHDQRKENRDSYPTVPDRQVAQHIVRPSTPEHQIIQPYYASVPHTGSWHSQGQISARQRQPAGSLRHFRPLSHSLSTVGTAIVVLQRCMKRRISDRNSNSRLRENPQKSYVLLKTKGLALDRAKKPDITAWILGCQNLSSSSNIDTIRSFDNKGACDDFGKSDQLGLTEEHTGYTAPSVPKASPKDYVELIRKHLDHLPDDIVEPLLAPLTVLFKSKINELTAGQPTANNSSASGSFDSTLSGCPQESSKSIPNSRKRASRDGDDEPPDDDDEKRHKKRKLKGESNTKNHQRWACPFYQRDPHLYCVETEFGDFRKCAKSPGFSEVHRIKEHIKECHSLIYCVRCFAIFKTNEDLEAHGRKTPACDVKQRPAIQLLSADQKTQLNRRDRTKVPEERWNTIYQICFPQDNPLPSPYYVHYSQTLIELQIGILRMVEEEPDRNRLYLRINELFNTQRLSDRPATVIPRTPLILTPSTSHDSNGSTEMSSQTQARETYCASPSVKHCTERFVLATSSGNSMFPSSELLKPANLPRPGNSNQVCSLDKLPFPDGAGDLPMPDFRDEVKSLGLDQNDFDIAQSNLFNHTALQPDANYSGGLFDMCEESEMAFGDLFVDNTPSVFD